MRGEKSSTPASVGKNYIPQGKPQRSRAHRDKSRQAQCGRCGKSPPHAKQVCPAHEAECHKCHMTGHYKKYCRTKKGLKEVTRESQSGDEFLGSVTIGTAKTPTDSDPWRVKLNLNNRSLDFKVDTSADVTVIPKKGYTPSLDGKVKTAKLPVVGPTGEKFTVKGKFTGALSKPREVIASTQEIYVIKNLRRPLLGRPAIEALRIVAN